MTAKVAYGGARSVMGGQLGALFVELMRAAEWRLTAKRYRCKGAIDYSRRCYGRPLQVSDGGPFSLGCRE